MTTRVEDGLPAAAVEDRGVRDHPMAAVVAVTAADRTGLLTWMNSGRDFANI
jgi:hypothetical protein